MAQHAFCAVPAGLEITYLPHGHVLPRDPWKELDALAQDEPHLIE